MKKIPTFFIDGFLDSGKTTYLSNSLAADDRAKEYRTLIICCEQGEVEYDEEMLKRQNATIRYVESVEEFNGGIIQEYIKEVNPQRVFIEMNGMWDLDAIFVPRDLDIRQAVLFADAETFDTYFVNMRQMIVARIQRCQIMCFTKVKNREDLAKYQTQLRLINQNASYFIMDENSDVEDAFDAVLPYDIDADIIDVKDQDYGTFYIDSFDNRDKYAGKTVEFDCQVFINDKMTDGFFMIGRWIMNCCSNDVQLFALPTRDAPEYKLKDRDWIHVVGKISYEWSEKYEEEEMIITPISIVKIPEKEEVLNLVAQN